VLIDESMPELTGTALAAEIVTRRPDLPIVWMSGWRAQPGSRRR